MTISKILWYILWFFLLIFWTCICFNAGVKSASEQYEKSLQEIGQSFIDATIKNASIVQESTHINMQLVGSLKKIVDEIATKKEKRK